MATKILMRWAVALFVTAACSQGQALSSAWFPLNWANSNLSCNKPSNVAVSNGLTLTESSQTVNCGDGSSHLTSWNYTAGFLIWNSFSFTYGHIAFRASLTALDGAYSAVWLMGMTNASTGVTTCQAILKSQLSSACLPGPSGYTEIDGAEILNSTTSINQQIHVSTGSHNDGCSASVADVRTAHNYEIAWSAGSLVWYVDGTVTCTITQAYVPSVPMFLLLQSAVWSGGGTLNPAAYPKNMLVSYIRVCPTSTAIGSCTAGNASIFDEEFSGTGPQSTIYVGQQFTGSGTGADCGDAYGILNNQQISWINDPGYWTNGIIGPGTNLHLCGAITTQPIAQGSGTSGAPVTFTVEAGALLQNPRINVNGQTNIVSNPAQLAIPGIYAQAITMNGGVKAQ